MDRDRELSLLARRARSATVRLRVNDALRTLARWLPLALTYVAVALAVIQVTRPSPAIEQGLVLVAVVLATAVLGMILRTLLRFRRPELGALALDRHHGLADRVTNALEFSGTAAADRTPLMAAAISDGVAQAHHLDPRRAVPVRVPAALLTSLVLTALVVLLAKVEVVRPRAPVGPPPSFVPLVVSRDDLDLLRQMSEELNQKSRDPALMAAARRFNQLVEDIGAGRLDRHQVLTKLEELDRELLKLDAGKAEAIEQGLEGLASELQKSGLSKPIAAALKEKNLADAEQALRELAQKLKAKPHVDRKELEQLRQALESAAKNSAERRSRFDAQRHEAEPALDRLLKKKANGEPLSAAEQEQLDRQSRQLERLDRQRQSAAAAEQALTALDRELAEAAKKLMEEMSAGAEHLEQGAVDLNRMAREQMSQADKEQLKQRLEELRALLREQGKGGADRADRLQQFARRARGQSDSPSNGPSPNGPKSLTIDPNGGGSLPIPVPGKELQASNRSGSEAGQPGGSQWGNGSDPSLKGEKSRLGGKMQDVSAAGIDTGEGPSVSSVVYGAAERGFAGGGYRKVYTDYKTAAEEAIERDRIPSGYEFYVRRYFQLIRPRD